MSVTDAFNTFQGVVNADVEHVREARARRDLFKGAFTSESDVNEVVPSGSLARGTHKDPIHDVDVVIVFDDAQHPEWGRQGSSAEDALDYTRKRVNALLGVANGTFGKAVRLARWRNHAVKCFLDDPDDPNAFTVDAMPALRRDGKLLIPEAASREWVYCNPEYFIEAAAQKHAEWNSYAGTVRMLKWWASEQDVKIKSLVMEVLALRFLSTEQIRPAAIKQFFVSALYYIEGGNEVVDPASLCGPIQSDLDYEKFAECVRASRDASTRAFQAQANNNPAAALQHWGDVFGAEFPKPPSGRNPLPAAVPALPRTVKDTPQG
ncbi:nucleotidyltransferase domain-containing protein [Paenarthrobacter sp. PH39-S1]|uniref:nucleotidyltransferase domain-containing protein n=1 Tax=Paenarthrobacter sp. PH39-S1 TaxID=3046204 RepID=UPI0024BB6F07|nr:nucleotidyltransferase domain-containing protein [Paenarthrobacter sp. PH39-S1]MDJ0356629.1 nucleotidyltransferase domain-containing protein [Paenarthrobacter sp. PH39-S1]